MQLGTMSYIKSVISCIVIDCIVGRFQGRKLKFFCSFDIHLKILSMKLILDMSHPTDFRIQIHESCIYYKILDP